MNTESQIDYFNRISREETKIANATAEAQRLADCVVDAAIDWHKSDAQVLEDAIEELLEFRRKMSIVKPR